MEGLSPGELGVLCVTTPKTEAANRVAGSHSIDGATNGVVLVELAFESDELTDACVDLLFQRTPSGASEPERSMGAQTVPIALELEIEQCPCDSTRTAPRKREHQVRLGKRHE